MSAADLEQAKRNAVTARATLDSHVAALQLRLRPAHLANEAWDGVKDKSADLADGALEAVRKRPGVVAAALGALGLFMAREPLKRAAIRLISGANDDQDGIEGGDSELTAQGLESSRRVEEGVS